MPYAAQRHKPSTGKQLHSLDMRATASSRGYNSLWSRTRAFYLAAHPLCRACETDGVLTAATCVDHIVSLSRGGSKYDESNLQSLCHACHSRKTWAERRENKQQQSDTMSRHSDIRGVKSRS